MKSKPMAKFQFCTYDVWGNAKDGYEVNDVFSRGHIEIPVSVLELRNSDDFHSFDSRLMKSLRKVGVLKGFQCRSVEIEGEPDYTLYFNQKRDSLPLCELRRVRDE